MQKVLLIIILLGLIAYFVSMFIDTTPIKKKDNFVKAQGQDLYLEGDKFRSIGVNRYNLLTYNKKDGGQIGCANSFSEKEVDVLFSRFESLGITTVRFWLFQKFTQSGEDLMRFDYVLRLAKKHNIKVIPVLENHWQDCTEGGEKSASWYQTGYLSPYGAYPLSLKDYINKIVPKYKDNANILFWEIMNEANSSDHEALYLFAQDVSSYIKSLDTNHLITVGVSGTRESFEYYQRLSTISTIDILDYHDYDLERNPIPDSLGGALIVSRESNKPLVIGESGIKNFFEERPGLFQAKINAFFNQGGAIYMIWSYGEDYITNDGFNFSHVDPVAQIVKKTAEELKK